MLGCVKSSDAGGTIEVGEGAVSPSWAVYTVLVATLGAGNIVGVVLAMAIGDPRVDLLAVTRRPRSPPPARHGLRSVAGVWGASN